MGAVFGIVGQGSLAELQVMRQRLAHRGPYHQVWSPAPGVYFGQIARYPLRIDSGWPLAEDAQLDGEADGGRAELLQREGGIALSRLRGCFTLAFYDTAARRLVLAVDQVGYKVLYYTVLRDRLAFASEYKALLALPDLVAEPDRTVIQHYLATKVPWLGRTQLKGVEAVAPGQTVEWTGGQLRVTQYWRPAIREVSRTRDGHAAAIREAFLRVVSRQVRGRDQIGITIGGGLDAAAVVGAVRRVAPDVGIRSFTVGTWESDPEILGGRETARIFGTEHREMVFRRETIPDQLPRLVWLSEDCNGREEALLQLNVLGLAGRHSGMVMGGHGADVLFGGMPRHRLVSIAEALPLLRGPLREVYDLSQSGSRIHSLAGKALEHWFYGGAYPPVPAVPGAGAIEAAPWAESLNQYLRGTVQQVWSLRYLEPEHELAGADFRSPFLDPDLIAVALSVPGALKVRWGANKAIFREAVSELVPPAISGRPKAIQRFGKGKGAELANMLGAMAEKVLPGGAVEAHGLLSPEDLRTAYEHGARPRGRNPGGRREQVYRLWTVLALECWAQQFLDRRGMLWYPGSPD